MDWQEYQESTTVRLDWTIRGLRQLFESSKGESKSKAVKSVKFGGGRWQILFYPNSGTEGGQFVSLYLSCEPTPEEKDNAIDGRWVRGGLYKFNFELRNLSKTILFSQKEAIDHSFSWKTANWGWAQFARRDTIYYQPNAIRNNDAFLISCTISSSPSMPSLPPRVPHRLVPKDLLEVVGTLLDDPAYSDVEFILPRRTRPGGRGTRRILAAKSILSRAEYFRTMFSSGFAEASSQDLDLSVSQSDSGSICDMELESSVQSSSQQFEDSDDEDEAGLDEPESSAKPENILISDVDKSKTVAVLEERDGQRSETVLPLSGIDEEAADAPASGASTVDEKAEEAQDNSLPGQTNNSEVKGECVREKSARSESPQPEQEAEMDNAQRSRIPGGPSSSSCQNCLSRDQATKHKVVVRDVAYTTYRAVLYYLYTDSIIFAPLASSFLVPSSATGLSSSHSLPPRPGEGQNVNVARPAVHRENSESGPTSRTAWIRQWELQNPGNPTPCSAKAAYRVADKLGLSDLKDRAFQHIVKSLTIHNVPYEMFSSFSSTFEDVRKMEVAFFLEHWNEIRASQSMQKVWQQIRVGRHPGFEEVWPLIAMNLEFKPRAADTENGNGRQGNGDAIP
ncbi:hypothetical protein ACEPAG_1636 [Sanghuangporus baumii]